MTDLISQNRHALRGAKVLVVEDEPLTAMLMEDWLDDVGAQVLGPAGSVEEAMQIVDQALLNGGMSAAILDINLGGEAVLPVADRLAAMGVPFIFATGYGADCPRGEHCTKHVLIKPFTAQALMVAVMRLSARAS
ncbi:response regulator [Belnapia sp. T18]|uniref:Response regulator n=1 Tax=Belnapia arida TaxID=2804533 RepID=A0ABS1UCD3_9PROT|nr:response regulator [Belnapia arida]MBL6082333.1 response regulator [Belnapia arida]